MWGWIIGAFIGFFAGQLLIRFVFDPLFQRFEAWAMQRRCPVCGARNNSIEEGYDERGRHVFEISCESCGALIAIDKGVEE